MKPEMRMWSGQLVDPLNITPEQVRFDDICFALANICRYGGHCHRHYSVAEHTIKLYETMLGDGCDNTLLLYALLHDAAEAYVGDIPAPFKQHLRQFHKIERNVQKNIARAVGIDVDRFIYTIEEGVVNGYDIAEGGNERDTLWLPSAHAEMKNLIAPARKLMHLIRQHVAVLPGMTQEKLLSLALV